MASVAMHCCNQYLMEGKVKLFEGSDGYDNGQQIRDFISVEDVIKVNLFFLDNQNISGIFNVGTGKGQTFNDVAVATINACRSHQGKNELTIEEMLDQGIIQYIPFPEALKGKYQSYTQANIDGLRLHGYETEFMSVEEGVPRYIDWLLSS
jgi:ADP-L-glycero-D-manno-heptose 6-epimerase